jgi:hypothetical protein
VHYGFTFVSKRICHAEGNKRISDLMAEAFGAAIGKRARFAAGITGRPLDNAVKVELIVLFE